MKYLKWLSFDSVLMVLLLVTLFLNPSNIFTFVVAIIGTLPVAWSALKVIYSRKVSIDLLAAIALVFSLFEHQWLSAIFINLMLTFARLLVTYNENRAKKNLESLLKLKPVKIKVERSGQISEILYSEVVVGDTVLVDLGDRVPVDGVVIGGEASIDESSLTGESIPVNKAVGQTVLSSGLVVSGNLQIKTEKVAGDTTLEKIIKMVEQAQIDKPEIHTTAEKFALWYLVAIFLGTILIYLFTQNFTLILAILLVVCADDIAVALPLTLLSAVSFLARKGVIIKGTSFLEALPQVKTIFVDKTGTLTKGKLKVENFVCNSPERELILKHLSICSEMSDHPMSKAIAQFTKTYKKSDTLPDDFKEISGNGVRATFKNGEILFGRRTFLENNKISISQTDIDIIEKEEEKGFNITLVAYQNIYQGYFIIADEVKENVKDSIHKLKALGVEKIIMLTGDNERVAGRIKELTGITDFYANLLPEQKLEYIRKSLNKDSKVAMIGDGINDAAALSLADIGIAMGGIGYDVAIESADIVLMKDDFSRVPEMIKVSKYVMKIARQDFVIWGSTNTVGLALVLFGILAPTGAAAYNFLTDFLPLINSTRIFQVYLREHL